MPRQSPSQQIGRAAERWFVSQLPPSWIFQRPTEDVGIDGVVVICEAGPANGLEFKVQVKGSAIFSRVEDKIVLRRIKRSAMRYWITGLTPTLVVAFEAKSGTGFFAWANEVLAPVAAILGEDGYMDVRLPSRRTIGPGSWHLIREQCRAINAALARQLRIGDSAFTFLRVLDELSGSLKYLYFAENANPADAERTHEQRALMCELELSAHRDVVRALSELHRQLADQGNEWTGLRQYADWYIGRVSSFFPRFPDFVGSDQRISVEIAPDRMAAERRFLMNEVASALHELTQVAVQAARVEHSDGRDVPTSKRDDGHRER